MPNDFQDGDLQKVQSGQVTPSIKEHDSMFETLDVNGGTTLDALLDGEDSATIVEPGEIEEGGEPNLEGEQTPPEGEGDLPPEGEATATPPAEGNINAEDPEVQKLLSDIEAASQAVDTAQNNLDSAMQAGDQTDITKAYNELKATLAEKDRQIELLTKQVENEKGQADRFLNEKFMAESDGREKGKIYEAVMENPALKDIVIYSMNAANNPAYEARLKDAVKKLYEETHGVSVDDILNKNRVAEKEGLADNTFMSDGDPEINKGLIDGMFEQL